MALLKIDLAFLSRELKLPACQIIDARISNTYNQLILEVLSEQIPDAVDNVTVEYSFNTRFIPVGGG